MAVRWALCAECHRPFKTRIATQRFCAKKCQKRDEHRRHKAEGRHLGPVTCSHCGREFVGNRWAKRDAEHVNRYCSAECVAEANRLRFSIPCPHGSPSHTSCARCGRHEPKVKGPICRLTERPSTIRWIAGPCAECGELFVGRWHPQWPCRYCSDKCINRVARRTERARNGRLDQNRKRARHYHVEYEPIHRRKVFERDGYRCQICQRKTRRTAKVPDPLAPTVDHIIPVSQGGPHLYINVQCACFRCNSLKGAGAANDQLRLVA